MSDVKKKLSVYCAYDVVSGELHHFVVAGSPGLAARNILKTLEVPLRDNILIKLVDFHQNYDTEDKFINFDSITWDLSPSCFSAVSWESYKFPETVADALSPLKLTQDELRELVNNRVNEIGNNEHREDVQKIVDTITKGE